MRSDLGDELKSAAKRYDEDLDCVPIASGIAGLEYGLDGALHYYSKSLEQFFAVHDLFEREISIDEAPDFFSVEFALHEIEESKLFAIFIDSQ